MAVDPLGRFVYVANNISSDIWAYQIGENGALTPVAGSPFSAGLNPYGVAVDFFGRFVYTANYAGNNVSAYHIAKDGALTPVAGSPFPAGSNPISVTVSPSRPDWPGQ